MATQAVGGTSQSQALGLETCSLEASPIPRIPLVTVELGSGHSISWHAAAVLAMQRRALPGKHMAGGGPWAAPFPSETNISTSPDSVPGECALPS